MARRARFPVGVLAFAILVSLFALPASASPAGLSANAAERAAAVSGAFLSVTPGAHDFGVVLLGASETRTYTVSNLGDQDLVVSSVTSTNPQFTSLASLPAVVPPSGSLAFLVRFAPTLALPTNAILTFSGNAVNGSVNVQATGEGATSSSSTLGEGSVLIAPVGAAAGDQFGNAAAGVGDVNGDGFPDVLIGAWASDVAFGDEGRAYLYFGGPIPDGVADVVFQGEGFRDNFGTSVSGAGDFNADGYADVLIGAWLNNAGGTDAGRAYLYFGGPSMDAVPDLVFTGAAIGDAFGVSVSTAGDVNGDGYSDVIVGANNNDAGGANAGRAYVYFGGPAADAVADLVLTGEAAEDQFGWSVSGGGDMNGDGFDDVVVGAYANDGAGAGAGRAYVYFGGANPNAVADWVFSGEAPGDRLGVAVALVGDPNGDGFTDLVVGADRNAAGGFRAGRAYIFHGGPVPDAIPDLTMTGDAAGGEFGEKASAAGDMNDDGYDDIVICAWRHPVRGPDTGRAFVYFAGPGMDTVADLTLTGERQGDLFGTVVAHAGDVDRDGHDEIVIGAQYYDETFGEDGRAYVVSTVHDRRPVVIAPPAVSGQVGSLLAFTVTAVDPDGEAIGSLAAAPLPSGASFTPNATNTSGDFAWIPTPGQAGSHEVVFTASNARSGSASTTIDVTTDGNDPPTLSGPAAVFGAEGVPIAFTVTASDPEGGHVTLGIENRPVGALYIDFGNNTGGFSWTPGFGQAGAYTVSFTGRDPLGAAAVPLAVAITVDDVNRPPTASAGGPYAGVINVDVPFDGTGSSDPDGDALTYAWDFGDGGTASGPNPLHAFAAGGIFTVSLQVSDGEASHAAASTATIQAVFPATAFLDAGNRTTRLQSAKASTCVQVEPDGASYANTDVLVSSIVMISPGTGSVDRIHAVEDKTAIGADRDRDGVSEITACFTKADLRLLFGGLSGGKHTVGVTLEGDLATGGRLRATLEMDVVVSGGAVAASLSPNPLRPGSVLTVRSVEAGSMRIQIFDASGRLVRTLLDRSFSEAGYHDVAIDGRRDDGARLGSGVYFYRVRAKGGTATGRFTILN